MQLAKGTVLASRYRLGAPLGRGGEACTYAAEDLLERREIALKLLAPARPIEALCLEFERLRGLVHPHLTRVLAFAEVQLAGVRRAFYTAERVTGEDLRAYVARVTLARARRALGDVLDALHFLHALGLRHGDVKPENVLVAADGRAVLLDLGCAAPLGLALPALAGTHGYLAPELCAGEPADERADLFAFGVTLRELAATGELATLGAQLTAAAPIARPSSAREVLARLGDERDVLASVGGRPSRCVGRAVELAAIEAGIVRVVRGAPAPRCVWIEGPPGVGRSRLVREASFLLARRGVDVIEASARVEAPFREALGRRAGPLAPGFEALLDQVGELSAGEPCALVLDDAQHLSEGAALELAVVLRALSEEGRCLALVASTRAPSGLAAAQVLHVQLAPLSERALGEWTDQRVEAHDLPALARFTGGYPRYVERTVAALVEGRMRAAELRTLRSPSVGGALDDESVRSLALSLVGLPRAALRMLAEIALCGSSREAVPALLGSRDLIQVAGASVSLAREADRGALLALLPRDEVQKVALRALRALAGSERPLAIARQIACLHWLGRESSACRLFVASEALVVREPRAFVAVMEPLVPQLDVRGLILLARALRSAGEAPRALSLLARARRRAASATLLCEAAEVYLALGKVRRAERMVARADALDGTPAELSARVLVRLGAYERARELAETALSTAVPAAAGVRDERERARLLESLGLALAYLGRHDEGLARVREASLLHPNEDLRARARASALRGFVLLRAGQPGGAVEAYDEALVLAESAGLSDLVLNALSSLASARQSLGQWGRALAMYERALRLARALARAQSVCSLRANLANLALEIGNLERAADELRALRSERAGGRGALAHAIALYESELLLLRGDARGAEARAEELLALPALPQRERVEARVLVHAARLARGELPAPLSIEGEPLPVDLTARVAEVQASALVKTGRHDLAVHALEQALAALRSHDDHSLLARIEAALAASYLAAGARALAAEHEARALSRWERIALDLPPTLRAAFWAHPQRRALVRASRSDEPGDQALRGLSRVRELNRRISSLHTREEVLAFALDAAIELTGAERGFVLLAQPAGTFEIAAARHMSHVRMPRREWRFSRSIAERVTRDGEPILTVDAGSDPRFARKASVHAMQLKSVLCAPIRSRNAILGALYLDNRVARARFAAADAELLLTFADQVAIALSHAALVTELEARARELAGEKRKVEQLARGQAREIERLSVELSAQRAALGLRYDYGSIVAHSPAMRALLARLDRVVDSDLSVLIQGESGTGKELLARALHQLGARKDRPFVSINCAAMPEALLESELFGHVRGAFTGALTAREGLFVSARSGTLLLDELGELPLSMQAKLLRVLNDGEVRPVGATKSFAVDVRLVCATNRNLRRAVQEGRFREDLYYRVAVVELTLPPLRERHEDLVPLAEALLARRAEATGEPLRRLAPDAVRALLAHPFPGNVRELENTLLRASVMAVGETIRAEDLGLGERTPELRPRVASTRDEYRAKEAERLLCALEAERWNVSKVAKNLGLPRNTLYRKLQRYGIERRMR